MLEMLCLDQVSGAVWRRHMHPKIGEYLKSERCCGNRNFVSRCSELFFAARQLCFSNSIIISNNEYSREIDVLLCFSPLSINTGLFLQLGLQDLHAYACIT